jgi:hypothetical protein
MSMLESVRRGKIKSNYKMLMYGVPGIGKSTFASDAPNPIFIDTERRTLHLDVARVSVASWDEIRQTLVELGQESHSYQTLVLDTLGPADELLQAKLLKGSGGPDMNGELWSALKREWRKLVAIMDRLQAVKGMNIILNAHAKEAEDNAPHREQSHTKYTIDLTRGAASVIVGWCDDVYFADYDISVKVVSKRRKIAQGGARVMHCQPHPAFVAKNSHDLPAKLPLSWEEFARRTQLINPERASTMTENIRDLAEGADNELRTAVLKATDAAGQDVGKLSKILDRLKARLADVSQDGQREQRAPEPEAAA